MATSDPVLEDASPLPSQLQSRSSGRQPHRGLFFRTAEEETPAPRMSPEGETPPAVDVDGSVSEPDWPSDESNLDDSDPSSSRASSAGSPVKTFSKKATKLAIAQGILTGTNVLHRVAARTEGQRAVGLYIAEADDAEAIADPLADIAGRREGIAGKVSPDTADAVRAMVALANYASKQIAATIMANDVDRHIAGGGSLQNYQPAPGPEHVQ